MNEIKKATRKTLMQTIIFGIFGIAELSMGMYMFFGYLSAGKGNGSLFLGLLGFLFIFGGGGFIYLPFYYFLNPKKLYGAFYERCSKEGITDIVDYKNKKKAELIANDMKLNFSNLEALFSESKQAYLGEIKKEEEQKQIQETIQLKQEWKTRYSTTNKYTQLYGREKRIQMLKDYRDDVQKELSKAKQVARGYYQSFNQKETDWAIAGGIASGIAGAGAGVAAALDAQAQNAKIRESNEQNRALFGATWVDKVDRQHALEEEVKRINAEIDGVKLKLIEEIAEPLQYIDNLSFTNQLVDISPFGAFQCDFNVQCKKPVRIHDEVEAVIDGTVEACMYQNDTMVGSALMSLPMYGAGKNEERISGVCMSGAQPNVDYRIVIKPYKLWLIEK